MNKKSSASAILFALLISACGNKSTDVNAQTGAPVATTNASAKLPPVETRKPNSNYKPAFEGQTRIAGVKTKTAYNVTRVTDELRNPWGIAPLPDGRLLITEKAGTMVIAEASGKLSERITGIPKVNPQGQGGLLGICLDPDFARNRMVYWVFSDITPTGNLTAVAKGKLSADDKKIENPSIIYRATPAYDGTLHYGGRIVFDRTGHLIVCTGERSDLQTRPQAQSLKSALGKVIRITTDGKPAADNPFKDSSDARPEFYSYGHRNPQGLAIHPATGDIWLSEMGPKGGDEVNLIRPGKNYGWPNITYGLEYSGASISGGATQRSGMEQPVYYWDPVTSPSGMTFYSGDMIAEWKNNLFIGGLNSTHIVRLVIENNKVTGEERLLANEGTRFRDVAQGKDGALYAVTDEGVLFRIGK
ncbi:MAG TPA: PQQ-dependent sugar dehydrogenase [Flavobacterium sp.]|jgi:glucose/arabinose dehydrogenase